MSNAYYVRTIGSDYAPTAYAVMHESNQWQAIRLFVVNCYVPDSEQIARAAADTLCSYLNG